MDALDAKASTHAGKARAFCLRVRGNSMYKPGGGPSYADGDIILVDPDREAKPGDRVIVRLDDQHEATFKQLLVEDGRKLLKALNTSEDSPVLA